MHLLKANSKPSMGSKKRKKIPLKGTFGQYKESKPKPQAQVNATAPPKLQGQPSGAQPTLQFMATAPQNKDAKMSGK